MYDITLDWQGLRNNGYFFGDYLLDHVPSTIQEAVRSADPRQVVFDWRSLTNKQLFVTNLYLVTLMYRPKTYLNYDYTHGHSFGQFDEYNAPLVVYGNMNWERVSSTLNGLCSFDDEDTDDSSSWTIQPLLLQLPVTQEFVTVPEEMLSDTNNSIDKPMFGKDKYHRGHDET